MAARKPVNTEVTRIASTLRGALESCDRELKRRQAVPGHFRIPGEVVMWRGEQVYWIYKWAQNEGQELLWPTMSLIAYAPFWSDIADAAAQRDAEMAAAIVSIESRCRGVMARIRHAIPGMTWRDVGVYAVATAEAVDELKLEAVELGIVARLLEV